MDESNASVYCSTCDTRLKRQVVGSNVLYYCRKCGRMSSAACLFETSCVLKEQATVSGISALTTMECAESNPEFVTES
ncbi:TPA: hypothetical protein HA351_07145 [Methanosarcinaceae archaeon]|nr:hypothetical protein [Methanosarcinaceae archaeon]